MKMNKQFWVSSISNEVMILISRKTNNFHDQEFQK